MAKINKQGKLAFIFDNFSLKILAIILALILWLLARFDISQRFSQ